MSGSGRRTHENHRPRSPVPTSCHSRRLRCRRRPSFLRRSLTVDQQLVNVENAPLCVRTTQDRCHRARDPAPPGSRRRSCRAPRATPWTRSSELLRTLCGPRRLRHDVTAGQRRAGTRVRPWDGYRRTVLRLWLTRRWLLWTLIAVLFGVACFYLGRWQWGRHVEQRTKVEAIAHNYGADPVPFVPALVESPLSAERQWTRVSLTGTYAVGTDLLVRNRTF